MKRVFLAILAVMTMGLSAMAVTATPVYAAGEKIDNCNTSFLGFRPWYQGICEGGEIQAPPQHDEEGLTRFIWTIVLNVIFDLTLAIGYIALGLVIYGGYLYIMSQGDPGKAAKGKKTLVSAITGTVIAMGASVIVNTIIFVLGIDQSAGAEQGFDAERLGGVINWALATAGLVAVIFIVKGGIDYMLARGDAGKVQQATRSLIFAVIGLIIVLLARVITGAVINAIGGAL